MYSTSPSYREAAGGLRKGSVCSAHDDLAGVQGPDGSLVPADMLGPGVVENLDEYGRVCVHWVKADFDVCLDPSDVRPLGPDAHLISVQRRDKRMAVLGGPPIQARFRGRLASARRQPLNARRSIGAPCGGAGDAARAASTCDTDRRQYERSRQRC